MKKIPEIENDLVNDMLAFGFGLMQIKAALEDGSWQAQAGISQEEAEEAYAHVMRCIASLATGKPHVYH
jgi:hypothetical protein